VTGIGILYMLGVPEFELRWKQHIFSSSYLSRLALELFPGGKAPQNYDRTLPSSAKVEMYFCSPSVLRTSCYGLYFNQ